MASIDIGNATNFEFGDNTFDYILLFGPFYHTQNYEDRITILREAKRVLKDEVKISGLKCESIFNIEGIHRIIDDFDGKIKNKNFLDFYMNTMRKIEHDSSLFGVASHLMAILKK